MERTRTDVTPALVDKALGSVRAGTKKKGSELCCMYVEVENSGEGVVVSRGFRMRDVKLTTV
jgi:cytoskeleton-associated protein 5